MIIWDEELNRRFREWSDRFPPGTLYGEIKPTQAAFLLPEIPTVEGEQAVSKPPPYPNKGGRPEIPIALDLALLTGSLREKAEQARVSYSTVRRRLNKR